MNRFVWFILCFIVLLSLAVVQAPSFLIVSDPPVKSDALVLFLGGEKGTREQEANQLVAEGYADYLIIPAHGQIKKRGPNGTLIKIDFDLKPKITLNLKLAVPEAFPNTSNLKLKTASLLEDTHQEVLIARDMMERLGISSAILVSSPYHMRRIKLISARVFGERATVCYVPTRYETPKEGFWFSENYDRKFVLTEYAKIGWFLLYGPFV
jgi:uncharacterized SAM-binding protein YcdF (DUF218 family)